MSTYTDHRSHHRGDVIQHLAILDRFPGTEKATHQMKERNSHISILLSWALGWMSCGKESSVAVSTRLKRNGQQSSDMGLYTSNSRKREAWLIQRTVLLIYAFAVLAPVVLLSAGNGGEQDSDMHRSINVVIRHCTS